MMLGRENPMVYTPEEIFNPTVANMVLLSMGTYANALREDYKDTQNKEEQFMKEYGSFMSPIAADQEYYYNNTLGGLGKMFEEADRQGVDLLRSQQGRALIQRYIMSRPYAQLANMRLSAETANQYRTLLAKGIADGTLDYATAIKLDGDLSKWDTYKKGAWSRIAPTSQKSVNQVLAPYIEDLYKHGYDYDPEASKKRPGYRVSTVSDQQIKDQLGKHASDILRDPMMQLRIEESGLTPEEYLNTELYQHLRDELKPKEEIDQYYKEKYGADLSLRNSRILAKEAEEREAAKAAIAHKYKMEEITARYGKGSGKPGSTSQTDGYSVSFHMYNQGNDNIGATEDVVKKEAERITNIKFKKYMKDGKMPESVKNNSKYQQALLLNERYVRRKMQDDKINNYARQHNARTGSMALATSIDAKAMITYPSLGDIGGIANKDANGNFNGTINAPAGTLFSIGDVTSRAIDGFIVNGKREKIRNNPNKTEEKNIKLKAGGKNFIQQIEADGRTHWYFGTSDGRWYHAGIYEESQAMSSMDSNFLSAHGQKTKPIVTPFPTDVDYLDMTNPYYMQQLYGE